MMVEMSLQYSGEPIREDRWLLFNFLGRHGIMAWWLLG